MNLPSITDSDLLPHVADLAALIEQGWKPCINILDTEWHVALVHVSLGTPMVTVGRDGEVLDDNWAGKETNIHERCRSLNVALTKAIVRAKAVQVA